MTLDDAYRILEVSRSASADQVKTAHRELTKVWHPDRFANDATMQRRAEEKLKAINEAYEVIRSGREGRRARPAAPRTPPAPPTVRQQLRRLMTWVFTCVLLGLFVLIRRPTPGGLVVAVVLFAVAGVIVMRMRALER